LSRRRVDAPCSNLDSHLRFEIMTAPLLLLAACCLFVGLGAAWDIRTERIPNWLTLGGLAAGLCLQTAVHVAMVDQREIGAGLLAGLTNGVLGVGLCGLVPYLLFRVEAMGGGDVKLLGAVGAFVGPVLGLEIELSAFVAMALFAPLRLAYEGKLLSVLGNSMALIANPLLPKRHQRAVPNELMTAFKFGPAVFFANAIVILMHTVGP
jgi:prepilin peptidase CpaA